ncbi:MAG: hypothetical protein R3F11_14505 [Verrucomicrobiales bacterium]
MEHEPCEGVMFLSIDGREQRWRVKLEKGISAAEVRTPMVAVV